MQAAVQCVPPGTVCAGVVLACTCIQFRGCLHGSLALHEAACMATLPCMKLLSKPLTCALQMCAPCP
jgi:hypothetical protein